MNGRWNQEELAKGMGCIRFKIAFLSLFVFVSAPIADAQRTLFVEPAESVSWDEIVARDAAAARSPRVQRVIPFISLHEPIEIGAPSRLGAATLPEPPEDLEHGVALGPRTADSFAGLEDDNSRIPPDTMGAVGASHLMVMLNSQVRIQSKTGYTISTVSLSSFWSSLTGFPFDPNLVYDQRDERWLATCDADDNSTSSSVFFAISDTSDPTGVWTFYQFDADFENDEWADYPGFGYNKNWAVITNNMFTVDAGESFTFTGVKMWVIDKSTALAGGILTMTVFPTGFDTLGGIDGITLQPCATFGEEDTLYLLDNSDWSAGGTFLLRLTRITGTPASPEFSFVPDAGGIFAGTGTFLVANNFNTALINAAQAGSAELVETNGPRLLNAVFRNGRVWGAHSGGLPVAPASSDRSAVFWYELDPALLDTTSPIVQSGVIDGGPGVHHFFPSIAVNQDDGAVVGFSRSDASRFVEAVYTGRNSGDAAGTMDSITVIKAGEDSYEKDFGSGRVRWGDYSATVVDPSDDTTFWTLQEYAALDTGPLDNNDRWGTWWAKIQNPEQFTPVYVASGHAGSNEGTVSDPFTDLQDALGLLLPGGVINIAGGAYDISTPQTIGKGMTLKRNGGGNVVVQ